MEKVYFLLSEENFADDQEAGPEGRTSPPFGSLGVVLGIALGV